ncbi:TetR/AcrR family transcriptional regulator [Amycolatopsis pittospori]|uniref:TetR/AcrR family transcriptional regulator n=1 Tax=Amycolatopsis pittospori TaxID=2749434 RepID=UPI0015F001B4|nr:TetR/AcrR family transcriptional regulator [Amycolatopsis pittospori]
MTEDRQERAERILDAAADLLLRHGYRRVTVEDVAEHAGVGKGTLYLHWKTREQLFLAVMLREAARSIEDLAQAIEDDPALTLLHRMTRTQFLNVVRRPLLHAPYLADSGVLGKLAAKLHENQDPRHHEAFLDYLRLQAEHGLIRTDLKVEDLATAYQAVLHGFLLAPAAADPEAAADLLADTVARAFQPTATPPAAKVRAAAPGAIALFRATAEIDRANVRRAY